MIPKCVWTVVILFTVTGCDGGGGSGSGSPSTTGSGGGGGGGTTTNTPPTAVITAPADGASFTQGDAINFTGTPTDAETAP